MIYAIVQYVLFLYANVWRFKHNENIMIKRIRVLLRKMLLFFFFVSPEMFLWKTDFKFNNFKTNVSRPACVKSRFTEKKFF